MDVPRIRPTFDLQLSKPPDEAITAMRRRLGPEFQECSRSRGRCMDLFVDESERGFWSPHLSVQLEERDGGSQLHGRYAPHPEVWTLFVFLYSAFGFLALIGLGWGFAQYVLGRPLWGLLLTPAALAAIAVLHLGARYGQRRTEGQMVGLRERLDTLLGGMALANADESRGESS